MIKNGRPYSVENGHVDDALITSHSDEEITIVKKWIADNIKPSSEVLENRTSYGLKHILQKDTKIYLTNNEFKDAMLLEGYEPVDPNELNWEYRIIFLRDINDNPSEFFIWAKKYKDEQSPKGDFVCDMISDFDFPKIPDYKEILNYLKKRSACDDAIVAFKKLWKEYDNKN